MENMEQRPVSYRLVKPNDFDRSTDLSCYAFQMELSEEARSSHKKELSECLLWGAYIDDQLAAQVQLLPLHVYIQGKRFAMGGVANVASWPEHRRGGMVAELLRIALERMRRDGQTISYLAPFSIAFYRRFGWETVVERKKLTIPSHVLAQARAQATTGTIARVTAEPAIIAELYERYAAQYNGMISRSETWWQRRIFDRRKGELAVYLDDADIHQGYLHYRVKNRELLIHEYVALTDEARRSIWRYIALHESSIAHVSMYAPMNETVAYELGDASIEARTTPYFMARIVDVEAFLNAYPFRPAQQRISAYGALTPVVLWLEVIDEHARWNAGLFRLTVDSDGHARVEREEGADAQIRMDILTLSALLMGSRKVEHLYGTGRIAGSESDVQRLEVLIPSGCAFMNDFF